MTGPTNRAAADRLDSRSLGGGVVIALSILLAVASSLFAFGIFAAGSTAYAVILWIGVAPWLGSWAIFRRKFTSAAAVYGLTAVSQAFTGDGVQIEDVVLSLPFVIVGTASLLLRIRSGSGELIQD